MLEQIVEVLKDTLIDGLKLLPFLFLAYLLMEYIEHKTGKKTKKIIKESGKLGPLWGSFLGIFPQCGFSAAASNLYAAKLITSGTLIAVYLSTSDEMIPVLISQNAPIDLILKILGIKFVIGILMGFLIDIIGRFVDNKIDQKSNKKGAEEAQEIEHICEKEHCHCHEDGILKSSINHTLNIFLFIIIITLIINALITLIGEENIKNIVLNKPVIGPLIAGIIGLIPNCAGSVILTELYLSGIISLGSMIGGLLVGSGVGILVLYRVNKDVKDNLKITFLLYVIGIIFGIIINAL